jgi:hypothetical protein
MVTIVMCTDQNVTEKTGIMIKASGVHEDYLEVLESQNLGYSFVSSKPVKFNIHYHLEKGTFYPVSEDNISVLEGTFHPESQYKQKIFCMMWENPHHEDVSLTYKFRIEDFK